MTNDDESQPFGRTGPSKITGRTRSNGRSLDSSLCSFESFQYYPDEGTFQALFDPDDVAPSEAVVGVISEADGVAPIQVEELGSKTDVEALDALITNRRQFDGDVHVSFTLDDHDVSLSSYGSIVVRPHAPAQT